MALTILTGSSQAVATNYSYRTSGSADWSSVPTASYFYDIIDRQVRYRMPNGDIQSLLTFPFSGSALITGSLGVTGSLSTRAQGALSTDLAFRVRNSADTRDIFNIRGNRTIELLADTPATNGGISITSSPYNEATINFYDSFTSNKMRIDAANALISVGGSGNIRIGAITGDNYMGMVTPSTNNRFLKLVDAFSNEYLSIGGNSYDGGGGISMTLKTTTNNGTNFVTFSRSNNTNPVVINDQANVGIGTSSPGARLDVRASGSTASDIAFRIRNSVDTSNIFQINGNSTLIYSGSVFTTGSLNVVGPVTASNLIVSSSATIGFTSSVSTENTLTLGPPPAGGTGEGGQLGLAASGGLYTSASMIDNWQNQFRILRGTNAGSNAGLMYMDLQTGNTQFVGAVTASAYSGLPNDYLYVTRNTTQTIGSGTWADRDIIFNNSVVSKGISYNTSTGLATLTAGKVYRITSRLAWSAAAAYLLEFSCYNSSNTQLGPTTQIVQSTNGSNNISDGTLDFIYAPGSNVDIKIRTTANTTALTGESIRGDLNTQLIIQQIA